MSSNGKTLKFRAAKLKGFTVYLDLSYLENLDHICSYYSKLQR